VKVLPLPALAAFFLFAVFPRLEKVAAQLQLQCQCQLGVSAELIEGAPKAFEFGEHPYPTASTYKLPIAIAFLKAVDAGRFRLDQDVRVLPIDIVHGVSRIADERPHGGQVRVSRLLSLMITESDNSASDAILRILGGPTAVSFSGIHIHGPGREMQMSKIDIIEIVNENK